MANYFAHTVTTTATKVLDAIDIHRDVFMQLIGNETVYLGDDNQVTTSNGLPIVKHSEAAHKILVPGQELWAIVGSGTESLRIFTIVD
jgi:hypothetical protein